MYKKDIKDIAKSRQYFSENPTPELAKLGNSFYRLTLECIWVWAKWFPIDPDTLQMSQYKIALEKLMILGVVFPKVEYFDVNYIYKYLPEQMVPIKVLKECKQVIEEDIKRTHGITSPTKKLAGKLYVNLRRELDREERDEVFYSGKIKRALKNKHHLQAQPAYEVDNETLIQSATRINLGGATRSQQVSPSRYQEEFSQYNKLNQDDLREELHKVFGEKEYLEKQLIQKNAAVSFLKQKLLQSEQNTNTKGVFEKQTSLNLNKLQYINGSQTQMSSGSKNGEFKDLQQGNQFQEKK